MSVSPPGNGPDIRASSHEPAQARGESLYSRCFGSAVDRSS